MRRILRALPPGFAVVALAACGGGSDAPAPPENLVQITSANAPAIAGSVLKATYDSGELGAFADLSGGIGGAGAPKPSNVYSKVGEAQIAYTKPMLTDSQVGVFQAPIEPIESMCPVSGMIIVSGDVANEQTLTMNDVLTIEFDQCNDGVSIVDGIMSMTIREFSGDFVAGSVTFRVAVSLIDFSVTEGGVTQTAAGVMTIGMDLPLAGPLTMTIETEDLSVSDGSSTDTLASFLLVQTIDPITDTVTTFCLITLRPGLVAIQCQVVFLTAPSLKS